MLRYDLSIVFFLGDASVCLAERDIGREIEEEGEGKGRRGETLLWLFFNSLSQKSCPEDDCSVPLQSRRFLE